MKKYNFIPEWKIKDFKSQTEQFCNVANEYYKKKYKLEHEIHKVETQLKLLKQKSKRNLEDFRNQCPHNYIEEPREYQSPREWTCSLCNHRL